MKHFLSAFLLAFGMVTPAFAVLPPSATTAFNDLQTDALALIDLAWTVLVPVTVAFIILRMFRRAASSAA
jgi:hypothetical protein